MGTFEGWWEKVDAAVWRLAGCSIDDLPDVPLRDWYDDGTSPAVAARLALKEARG